MEAGQASDVGSMGVKDLRALILRAGLKHDDCLELSDLRERAREALAALAAKPAVAPTPAPRDSSAYTSRREAIAGFDCLVAGTANVVEGRLAPDLAIVFLHGFGASNADFEGLPSMLGLADGAESSILWVFPQAPVGTMFVPAWWTIDVMQWIGAVQAGEAAIAKLIRDTPPGLPQCRQKMLLVVQAVLARAKGLPASRLVLGGFSQGAMTALDAAYSMAAGEHVGGVVSVSGAPIVVEEWSQKLRTHRRVPVLITHGTADTTIPFAASGWLEEFLKHNGVSVEKVVHSGGHTLGPPTSVGAALRNFLLRVARVAK